MRAAFILTIIVVISADAAHAADDPGSRGVPLEYREELQKATLSPDSSKIISVIGTVPHPHGIPATEHLTVSSAIESAGGFNNFANRRKVGVLRRKEDRFFTVDIRAVLDKKPGAEDPLLRAGDVVIVITRLIE